MKNCLGIPVDSGTFKIQPHSSIAVGVEAFFLLLTNDIGKSSVLLWLVHTTDKTIITTSGYLKETAHDGHRIFLPMAMDDCIFCLWPHFLPVDCRKSRSSLFSIFRRSISYLYSSALFASPFLGRPRCLGGKPAAKRACSRLYRLIQFLICSFSSPKCSAISRRVFPALRIAMISGSNAFMFVHFLLLIATPPDVVLFSYIRGCFVYVRFYWTCS